jgi:hypothetical protein
LISTLDGTEYNPYDHVPDAIERAYELAAPYFEATITILFEYGDHHVIRSKRPTYLPLLIDKESNNMNLIIRPLYCDDY